MVAGARARALIPQVHLSPARTKGGCMRGSVHKAPCRRSPGEASARSPNTQGEDGNLLKGPHDGPAAHMAATQRSPGLHAIRASQLCRWNSGGYRRDEDLTAGG